MAQPDEVTGPMNIGNPHEITIRELAETIVRLTEAVASKLVIYKPLPQDDPTRRCPDITLAKKTLDWFPTVPLEDGLSRTIAYFKALL